MTQFRDRTEDQDRGKDEGVQQKGAKTHLLSLPAGGRLTPGRDEARAQRREAI